MNLFHKISQLGELWFRKNILIQPQSFHSIHLLIAITHQWTISSCFSITKNYSSDLWIPASLLKTVHFSLWTNELAGCPFTNSFVVKPCVNFISEGRPSHSSWFEHILLLIKLCCTSSNPAHQTKENPNKFHHSNKCTAIITNRMKFHRLNTCFYSVIVQKLFAV